MAASSPRALGIHERGQSHEGHASPTSRCPGYRAEPVRPGAVVVGGVLAGAALTGLALTAPGLAQPGYQAALACWVTLTYVLAGLVAWRAREPAGGPDDHGRLRLMRQLPGVVFG